MKRIEANVLHTIRNKVMGKFRKLNVSQSINNAIKYQGIDDYIFEKPSKFTDFLTPLYIADLFSVGSEQQHLRAHKSNERRGNGMHPHRMIDQIHKHSQAKSEKENSDI